MEDSIEEIVLFILFNFEILIRMKIGVFNFYF